MLGGAAHPPSSSWKAAKSSQSCRSCGRSLTARLKSRVRRIMCCSAVSAVSSSTAASASEGACCPDPPCSRPAHACTLQVIRQLLAGVTITSICRDKVQPNSCEYHVNFDAGKVQQIAVMYQGVSPVKCSEATSRGILDSCPNLECVAADSGSLRWSMRQRLRRPSRSRRSTAARK